MGKGRQWLELAELGLLLLVFLTMLWGFAVDVWQVPFMLLLLTLGLNIFNRLDFQRRQRRQALGAMKHLERKVDNQLVQLTEQVRNSSKIKSDIAQLQTKEQMQNYLGSLEKSLTNVVQYLNQEALDERIQNLEQELLRLQQESLARPQGVAVVGTATLQGTGLVLEKSSVVDPWDTQAPLPKAHNARQKWESLYDLVAHKDCVSALDFSDDSRLLASGSWDRQLKVWQVTDGKQISQITAHDQGLLNLRFLDGLMDGLLDRNFPPYAIASSSFEPSVKLWHLDLENAEIPQLELKDRFNSHQAAVCAMATTPDGNLLTGSHDQTICQWRVKDGQLLQSCFDPDDQIQAIASAPAGNLFVTGGTEGVLKFWRNDSHQLLGSLGNDSPEAIAAIAIRSDGSLFASGGDNGTIYLWQLNLNTLETLPDTVPCFTLSAHDKPITHLRFNPQGNFLVSSSVDGTIKIWQLGIEFPLATLFFNDVTRGEHARLLSLSISADGRNLAAGGSDGRIRLWRQVNS